MRLDTEYARALFPAFREPSLRDWANFESASGSFTCRHVVWRLSRFYKERKVQPDWPFPASVLAAEEIGEARDRLARAFGVAPDELVFGASTTANSYVLANAFAEWLGPGDAIVLSEQDHEATAGHWRRLARRGVEIRSWPIDPETGHLSESDLLPLLDERVRLVCFPHVSNVVGEINDVASLCRVIRRAGAVSCVDGVSYAPHGLPNLSKLMPDIYLVSAYKTFGPHQGLMYLRRSLAMELPAQGFECETPVPVERLGIGGADHASIAACAGIADYIDAIYDRHYKAGRDATARTEVVADLFLRHERELTEPLLDYLGGRSDWRLLGPRRARDRVSTFAIVLPGSAKAAARALAERGIMAGAGDFHASGPLHAMGVDADKGVLRLSCLHYTSEAELDRLIAALDQL